jgi:hypothetical protein
MTNARLLAAILLLCWPTTAVAQSAGAAARMLPFEAVETPEAREAARAAAEAALVEDLVLHRCTSERDWCAELVRDGESWRLELIARGGANGAGRRIAFEPPDRDVGEPFFALWPHLIREADGAVTIGLLASRRTGFSGGGAMATRLILVRVEPGASEATLVATLPVQGSAMIRACFSEEDMRQRRQACHDEYEFAGTLTLAPVAGGRYPWLLFVTRARTYPGEVTRWEDSAERPRLRRGDLVWANHAGCSYRRSFGFEPAAGRYVADSPLPDCGQFLVGEMALEAEEPAAQ